jgi:hypothetical protein
MEAWPHYEQQKTTAPRNIVATMQQPFKKMTEK